MLQSIINQDWSSFKALLTVLAVLYACVFVSVLIRFVFRHETRQTPENSSYKFAFGFFLAVRYSQNKFCLCSHSLCQFGYRRTITKLTSYFGLMLMLSIADIAASVVFKMPYFTVLGAIGIVIVEAKSVFENLKQEEKSIEEIQKTLLKIFENGTKSKPL